jgi:hypothetical protein
MPSHTDLMWAPPSSQNGCNGGSAETTSDLSSSSKVAAVTESVKQKR